MFEAHASFRRLLCSTTGLNLTEAAGELATKDGIINLLSDAGYSGVQVLCQSESFEVLYVYANAGQSQFSVILI